VYRQLKALLRRPIEKLLKSTLQSRTVFARREWLPAPNNFGVPRSYSRR
jgi:hypothetical protein